MVICRMITVHCNELAVTARMSDPLLLTSSLDNIYLFQSDKKYSIPGGGRTHDLGFIRPTL
eukprot:scaffold10559_cov267-Chaetoceros_neogracile.AAC.8